MGLHFHEQLAPSPSVLAPPAATGALLGGGGRGGCERHARLDVWWSLARRPELTARSHELVHLPALILPRRLGVASARVLCTMVATSPTSGAVAPWTVISQGSSLTYEQATGLDKLEFAQRSQGSALSRLMDDEGHVKRATVRHGGLSGSASARSRSVCFVSA